MSDCRCGEKWFHNIYVGRYVIFRNGDNGRVEHLSVDHTLAVVMVGNKRVIAHYPYNDMKLSTAPDDKVGERVIPTNS